MNIDEPILESSSLSAKSNNPLSFAAMALSCAADILLLKHIERAGPKLHGFATEPHVIDLPRYGPHVGFTIDGIPHER